MGLFAEKLEQVEPGFGIDEITLATDVVETIDEVQGEWGGGGAVRYRAADEADRVAMPTAGYRAADEEELADLLDRLGNRFGFGRIGRPMPRQSWLPERAAHRESPLSGGNGSAGHARQKRNGGSGSSLSHGLSPGVLPASAVDWPVERLRPLRLISPLEAVEVVTAEPGGPLLSFRRQGRSHQLLAVEGPERLECEWWREDAPRRDYYLVEDETGCRYWLFRVGGGGSGEVPRWFLHGVFG